MMASTKAILKEYDSKKELLDAFGPDLEELFVELMKKENIKYNSVLNRVKVRKSLRTKIIHKNNKYNDLSEITDVVGLRIITYFSEDVQRIAELIERHFNIDEDNSINKMKAIKADQFGYISMHYIVSLTPKQLKKTHYKKYEGLKAEIQIRSILQHAWAEIEHDLGYKLGKQIPWEIRRSFSRVASLLETADIAFNDIRNRMDKYEEEILFEINNNPERVKISDKILKIYLTLDNELHDLNQKLHYEKQIYYQEELHRLGSMLAEIGVKNIKELEDCLKAHEEILEAFQKEIDENVKNVIELLSTYLICEQGDPETIRLFFKTYKNKSLSDQDIVDLQRIVQQIQVDMDQA